MPAPTACIVSSLITLHSYASKSCSQSCAGNLCGFCAVSPATRRLARRLAYRRLARLAYRRLARAPEKQVRGAAPWPRRPHRCPRQATGDGISKAPL